MLGDVWLGLGASPGVVMAGPVLAAVIGLGVAPSVAKGQTPGDVDDGIVTLTTSGGFAFPVQVEGTGALREVGGFYEDVHTFSVNGRAYTVPEGLRASAGVDGRQWFFPIRVIDDVEVWREVYVPDPSDGGDWIRYVDVVENPNEGDRVVDLTVAGTFGCCSMRVVRDDRDAKVFAPGPGAAATSKGVFLGNPPRGARAAWGPVTTTAAPGFEAEANRVTIPPGGRLVTVTFGVQGDHPEDVADTFDRLEGARIAPMAAHELDAYRADVWNTSLAGTAPVRVSWRGPRRFEEGVGFDVDLDVYGNEIARDRVSWAFDLDGDGTFSEAPNRARVSFDEGATDGDARLSVPVRVALDGGTVAERFFIRRLVIHVGNAPPRFRSPPPGETDRAGWLVHEVEADDPSRGDPVGVRVLDGCHRLSPTDLGPGRVRFEGTVGHCLDVPGGHVEVCFEASDDDAGLVVQCGHVRVSGNRPPTRPMPIFPSGVALEERSPFRIAVANARDSDLADAVTYRFQLDTTPTFDGPDLVDSGPIVEAAAFTTWMPDVSLSPGTVFWRVRAGDGALSSGWAETSFAIIELGAGSPPDEPPFDEPGRRVSRGCTVGAPLSALPWPALLVVLLARRRTRGTGGPPCLRAAGGGP